MLRKYAVPTLLLFVFLAPIFVGASSSEVAYVDVPLPALMTLPPASDVSLSYLDALADLASRHGAVVSPGSELGRVAAPNILVTQIERPSDPTAILLLFHDTELNSSYFLRMETDPLAERVIRIWGPGSTEVVISEDGAWLEVNPSDVSFRIQEPNGGSLDSIRAESATTDAIACIARTLGLTINPTTIRNLLSTQVCTASNRSILILTAVTCLSAIDVPTPANALAILGCAAGIAQAISCGYANCSSSNSNCVKSISFGRRTGDSWTSSCRSSHRSGRYAKFFTFSLSSRTRVTIDLDGSVDSYLYLLDGNGTNGRVLAQDDDSGPGYDARITTTLDPGRYTVEATTYSSGATGSFAVTVNR